MAYQEKYMKLAIETAEKGRFLSRPNPFVGAVIVKDDTVIGLGYTQKCGSDHAEIVALKQAGDQAKGASLYVTLEPCCHYGKTPPCTEAIIKAGIKHVYAGLSDPNPAVNGKGFGYLLQADIEVEFGFMAEQIEKQLEAFLTWKRLKRPFVIMKNATSLDARIATSTGESKWITNNESRKIVHQIRAEVSAIISGVRSVIADDPLLNVRISDVRHFETGELLTGCPSPIRVILDPFLEIPKHSLIVETASQYPTLIVRSENPDFVSQSDEWQFLDKEDYLREMSCEVLAVKATQDKIDLKSLLTVLSEREISSVLVETGPTLATSFLKAHLVDKIYYFIAPKILGGQNTVFQDLNIETMDSAIQLHFDSVHRIESDILVKAYVSNHR